MATVVLVGTLDTKGEEYAWLAERIRAAGCSTILIDTGVLREPVTTPDVTATQVAEAAGTDLSELRAAGDRGAAMAAMARGASMITRRLHAEGRLHGVLGVGGSGGSAVASAAMRELPVGVPKLLVSTMASGDTSPYVGAVDVTMMYSVVDIAGINQISEHVLGNAAAAISSMANAHQLTRQRERTAGRPLIGASMFGVTTAAVDAARRVLDDLGYEVLVFHATGSGGQSMEALAASGLLSGILDLTTTELADDLVGGVLSAGPRRLEAAGRAGVPQVVSVGALDMVNFGPAATVPQRFAGRNLHVHNATVTLMRTTAEESGELGRRIAGKLAGASGPTALFLPLRGISAIDADGMPFHDPHADAALFDALRTGLAGSAVELRERDEHINDAGFAGAMAHRLHELIQSGGQSG